MRFDDSLTTVLATDTASRSGAEAAWRQLVDLVSRRRVPDVEQAVARLASLRDQVPARVRGATARALAMTHSPLALVELFAGDELAVAAPVLRTATLDESEWLALMPRLTPACRSVLRHRRDLPGIVVRGLESFGSTDFVLGHDGLPLVMKSDRVAAPVLAREATPAFFAAEPVAPPDGPRFEIADLVARIDAFRRDQPAPLANRPSAPLDRFDFHTDAAGVIRWVEGVARGPLIGLSLVSRVPQGLVTATGDVPNRASFHGLALHVGGGSSAAGSWSLAGDPRFDRLTGLFTGYAGVGRRQVVAAPAASASDTLRQLVHELRTPANAIGGFAELIATELLGPVPSVYRDRALLIGREAGGLTAAIDDLDTAARLEGGALELRAEKVDLAPLLARAVAGMTSDIEAQGVMLTKQSPPWAEAMGDERVLRRLIDRLLATVVCAAAPGERLHVQLVVKLRGVRLHVTRPPALPADEDGALLASEPGSGEGGLLLGTRFTLRLIRELADAMGGSFTIGAERLTLRLPSPVAAKMERTAAA